MSESARLPRKLAAILYADVAGYSRLTGEDEDATHRQLSEYLDVISSTVEGHRGRIMHYAGDALLAMFEAVVDALSCAAHIQRNLEIRNQDLPQNRKVQFRVGVNLGDVIEDRGDIYGDGVNVAARLESLAEPGGICISESVRTAVGNKLPMDYEYMGEQQVKNIVSPVKAYHARLLADTELPIPLPTRGTSKAESRSRARTMAGISVAIVAVVIAGLLTYWKPWQPMEEPASIERMAFPLPEEPSIVVLPFDSLSGDSEHDYVADGLTENIIAALAKVPEMFVIARGSAFTYKNKPIKGHQVSEDLGVRYVLKGSVQTAGDRLRVTANLLDAMTGRHVWSERYDRSMAELFSVQDDITREIVGSLQVELTDGEQARVLYRSTRNLDAWASVTRASGLIDRFTKADNAKARELAESAVALDPEYASGWTTLAWTHWIDMRFGFSASREESFGQAVELATKAAILDPDLSSAQSLLGSIHLARREYDQAIAKGRRAIDLSPNSADDHALLALTVYYVGDWGDTIELLQRAMRLSPYYPSWYLLYLGRAQTFKGDYQDAIATHEMGLARAESSDMRAGFHAALAFAHIAAGDEQRAREHMAQRIKLQRNSSVRGVRKRAYFKNERDLNRLLDALRQAGLPETPPLSLPDKPAIAVLPFTNMSGDPDQEYFSDGITEDLITDLSKLASLFIIARNSTFAYKGKSVEIPQIARELGVRYVLEGSVRRAGDQVRINAQLIDATTGGHLWAERYDGVVTNVFELQDKITAKIVTALAVRLTPDEQAISVQRYTDNPAAYDIFLKGWSYLLRQTPEDTAKALAFFKHAIELDPNYSRAYAALAQAYWNNTDQHFRGKTGVGVFESYENAFKFLRKARDNPSPEAHSLAARMLQRQRRFDVAMAEAKKAVDLSPNDSSAYETLIELLVYTGRSAEAIELADKAMRLDPRFPGEKLFLKGMAHFAMGRPEEALAFIKRARTHNPDPTRYSAIQTAALVELGRMEDAKVALGEYRGGCSGIPSLNAVMLDWPFEDVATAERLANGLIKAGLPSSPQRYYAVARQDRLSSEQIESTLFGKTMIGAGISPCFGDEFEVTRDQDGQIVKQGWITVFRDGVSRVEQDVICDPWDSFGDFCVPVFRNPHGTPDQQDEYLLFTINDIIRFSVVP